MQRAAEDNAARKLRVAAYCRVSTDEEEQASSYEVQIEHYTSFIQGNPEWELAGIFADEGISGTNTKKRAEFNRMIAECMAGKIDMVITKSISRFARNTLDCLKYIRQLKDKGIPVFFEKENINTMDSKGEVMLTIMASLAQQESESLSQNVKLGIQYRYQQGEIKVNHTRFLGYTKDENKQLVVVPEEAEIVRRIFREFLEGSSLLQIGKGLEADGILTAAGKPKWRPETIRKILKNEKYMGDALLQKTYTVDCLTKKRVINNGIVPQYYVENSHEAIIPREIYMQVQEELARRAKPFKDVGGKMRCYSCKYALSSIVFCGCCGELYRRITWYYGNRPTVVWRCVRKIECRTPECHSQGVKEADLKRGVVKAINRLVLGKEDFISAMRKNVKAVIGGGAGQSVDEIDERLAGLQDELVRLASGGQNYEAVVEEIYRLRELKGKILAGSADIHGKRRRVAEMEEFLNSQSGILFEFDDKLVRRIVNRVTVYDGRLTVEFKTGTEVSVEI